MSVRARVRAVLADIRAQELQRSIPTHDGTLIDFASNDYLGLSRSPAVVGAMREMDVVGSGGSRLLSGAHAEHAALEAEIAAFVKRERALLFSSGYLAALGAVTAVARIVRSAYSDELNHACVIDGLRLGNLDRHVFHHQCPPGRRERDTPAVLLTESVFGMSGAVADLQRLLDELGEEDVLIVDEAHALGLRGEHGSGVASAYDDARIVVLGTLSKAFGCLGGFVAGPVDFIELLVSTARSFIFDTSLPPALARAARAALRRIIEADDLRAMLAERVGHAAAALARLGLGGGVPGSSIVPIVLGETRRTLAVDAYLRSRGLYAPAIRPPTVPVGTSRLRVTIRADHQLSDIDRLADALAEAIVGAPA